jgi:hypothetical protein
VNVQASSNPSPVRRPFRFSALFVALVILIVLPHDIFTSNIALIVQTAAALAVVFGALNASRGSGHRSLTELALGVPFVAVAILSALFPDSIPAAVEGLAVVVFATYVARTVIIDLMRRDEVMSDAIFAAFCAYLLIAVAWSGAYVTLEALAPGSFRLADGTLGLPAHGTMYFSLVTLTTLGYGDIVPVGAIAQRVAALEAVAGVLYVAVVVSRLVAAYRGPQPNGGR